MALKITQDTFDQAVQENINDLGMSPEEAIQETVVQFQKQGVDLSDIIKELRITPKTVENIQKNLEQLTNLYNSKASPDTSAHILEELKIIKDYCDKGIQQRVTAAKAGAYNIFLNLFEKYSTDVNIKKGCLRGLISLMVKQPDLLDERGLRHIISGLKDSNVEVKRLTWKWIKECCSLHEKNRQKLMEQGKLVSHISDSLKNGPYEGLRETLTVCRVLVLDDDVRVEFGKAHEYARIIASDTLCDLVALLNRYKFDDALINDVILTFCALLVRSEFCQKVEDAGGIEQVGEILKHFQGDPKVVKNIFKFYKSLSGNDACKAHIVQKKMAPILAETLNNNKENNQTTIAGLSCIAALTLRSPENSKAFFEADVPNIISQIMRMYPDDQSIQKTASWAIRNMVSRCKDQGGNFLKFGVEDILKENLRKFRGIEYDTKAALRDLGCKVELKEEWTGKGGKLNTSRI